MMLTKYLPSTLHDSFDLGIDRLFDEAFHTVDRSTPVHTLAWNVYEKDDWFWLDVAVPGLTAKDVELTIKDGVLTMSVIHQSRGEGEQDPTYFVKEIGWDRVSRSMKLPVYVDAGKATASCKDGILSVRFPKRVEAMARQIPIEGTET